MLQRAPRKLRSFRDPDVDAQIRELVTALDWFLGIQGSDPGTGNWGTTSFALWVNNATVAAKVLKFWDGDEVKFIQTDKLIPRRVRQAAQPTPDSGELLVWSDSDDDSVHLVYEDADAGTVEVVLA